MSTKILALTLALLLCLAGCGKSSPAETVPAAKPIPTVVPPAAKPIPTVAPPVAEPGIVFSTERLEGGSFTSEDLKGSEVVLINLWEPWCGPCVAELPELERLYENYRDRGLLIVGVFYTDDMSDSAKSLVAENGITYPIVYGEQALASFETGYVPTSVFLDGEGHVLSEEPYIGSRSYEEWEELLLEYLK